MTVRTRLLAGFGAVVLLLLMPSLFAAGRLAQLRHLAVEGRSGQAAAIASLGRMQALLSDLDRLERSLVATSDRTLAVAAEEATDSLAIAYGRLRDSPYGEQALPLSSLVEEIEALAAEVHEHVAMNRIPEATEALSSMLEGMGELESRSAVVAESIDSLARQDFLRAERLSESARAGTLVFLLLALFIGGAVIVFTTHAVTSPLLKLRRAMAWVADGRFETPADLPYARTDEIGELSRSFQRMTARLDTLDRTKAEFLGMASHELKTPLNVITAYAELIEDELGDQISEQHRSMITGVADQAEIMAKRVSRLMDISRLEAGSYRLAPEPIRIEDLATGLVRMFEGLAADKGIDFDIRLDDAVPESIIVDVDIIRDEVLGNLVSNAFRFTPSGGRVTIEVIGREGGVDFAITDTGPGVPEEHRAFIFDKHYTSDRTRTVGSGLGLAIVKEMVELHGGLITLEDTPPEGGARFRVALPLTPASADIEVPGSSMVRR